jgi:hypothetical protein
MQFFEFAVKIGKSPSPASDLNLRPQAVMIQRLKPILVRGVDILKTTMCFVMITKSEQASRLRHPAFGLNDGVHFRPRAS